MKLPEKPPHFDASFLENLAPERMMTLINPSPEMKELSKKTNARYYYWDKFKQQSLPDSMTTEEAWFSLKIIRNSNRTNISLRDLTDKPFSFYLTPTMQSYLSKIDQYAAGNIALSEESDLMIRHNERYIISSLMEEGIASSQLEGAVETRKKAKQMLLTGKKPENHHQKMIVNNYQTIMRIRKEWSKEKLSKDLINQIHQSMSRGTLDGAEEEGRFRTTDDIHVIDEDQNILFVPPQAEKVDEMIHQLCVFANSDHADENFVHPVVKAILIHFWLAYIHPYHDGNGRTARALFYWYMLSKKYWLFEFLSISRIILNASKQYWRAFLYTEYDECDLNYFIHHQLVAINQALEDLRIFLVKKKREETESRMIQTKNKNLNERQRALLLHGLKHPGYVYTVKEHMNRCSVVYETARRDLMELEESGFLERHEGDKEYQYTTVQKLAKKLGVPE